MAVGLGVCIARWRTFVAGRALVTIWVVTLLMTFGRTTWGALYDIVPGSSDIFIRRFQMGLQFSGILLAGVGVVFLGHVASQPGGPAVPRVAAGLVGDPVARGLGAGLCIVALVLVLIPGLVLAQHRTYDPHNETNIGIAVRGRRATGPEIDRVLDYVRAHPRGRVYAGSPTNWGMDFTVGAVPVFKYLESKDVDEVGYTLRTASLMTDPEYFFDDTNPGDYPLFGIGYLIIPEGQSPPVEAAKIGCSGPYCLWALPDSRLHPHLRHHRGARRHRAERRHRERASARVAA